MSLLNSVLSNYLATKASMPLVPGQNTAPALSALREGIPGLFRGVITSAGLDANDFIVKGSCGEPNRSFAKVPWVGVFNRAITRSATSGYYVVLLFAEDMSSASLSLNQGYTAFKEQYSYAKLAREKLKDCATAAAAIVNHFPGFSSGPIDLKTDGELAMGYEVGSILSKTYTAGATPSDADLSSDLAVLLHAYAELMDQFPTSLLALDIEITDRNYQEAAQSIKPVEQGAPSTTGPQPLPMMGYAKGVSKYVRSPNVANRALQTANGICALSSPMEPHRTFMSRVRKTNYVEAHHLVPFSQQKNFAYSLDVEENIVALCPTCHKLLHYGTAKEQFSPLKALLHTRHALLRDRGIEVTFNQLKEMYRVLDEED